MLRGSPEALMESWLRREGGRGWVDKSSISHYLVSVPVRLP